MLKCEDSLTKLIKLLLKSIVCRIITWKIKPCPALIVVTKTSKDHNRPQTGTNNHKQPINDHRPAANHLKLPANNHNPPKNDHKPPANNHKQPNRPFTISSY